MVLYRPTFTAAIALFAIAAGTVSAMAQDPYQAMHNYDSQDRKAAIEIRKRIQAAGADRAQQAAIESSIIPILEDSNSTLLGKQEAAKFLWVVGSAKSVPILSKMLGKPEFNDIARYALERNSDPAAAATLRNALKSTSGNELVGIINSVGDRGDAAAVPILVKLASNKDSLAGEASITALGKIGSVSAISALNSMTPQTLSTMNALLIAAAKQGTAGNMRLAQSLYNSLLSPSNPVAIRAGAIAGLATTNAPNTTMVALKMAKTATEPTLQRTAARIAASSSNAADTRLAIAGSGSLPPAALVALLNAFADRNEVAASSIAVSALTNTDPDVQVAGIRSAYRISGSSIVPTLVNMAVSGDRTNVARESLALMNGPGVESSLINLAKTGKSDQRNVVINILGNRATAASNAAQFDIATSQDPSVSPTAIKVLAKTGNSETGEKLVSVLVGAKDDGIRDAAQSAIVAIAQRNGDANAGARPLLAAFDASGSAGKASIISALAELGGDSAFSLISKSVSSRDNEVKSAAMNALSNVWTDPGALPQLLRLSKSGRNKADRVSALRGYFRVVAADDRAGNDTRLTQVSDGLAVAERPEEKRQALSVLRNISSVGSVEMVAKALDDSELVSEAADAIIYLGTSRRRNNRDIPGIKGAAMDSALDKVISVVKDDGLKERAQKLRNG